MASKHFVKTSGEFLISIANQEKGLGVFLQGRCQLARVVLAERLQLLSPGASPYAPHSYPNLGTGIVAQLL
jgi:hypothetical protein